jgi:hypothetical protein
MDAIAGELRANAKHNEADDAIAFRQLLRARRPDLDATNTSTCSTFGATATGLGWSPPAKTGTVA